MPAIKPVPGRLLVLLLPLLLLGGPALPQEVPYGVAAQPWPESLGNHRARVRVEQKADAVRVHLPWRRRDAAPERKNVVVIDLTSGKAMRNAVCLKVDRESGELVFEPATAPGEYGIYYLPCKHTGASYFPSTVYASPTNTADPAWRQRVGVTPEALASNRLPTLPQARVIEFQARTEFDRMDPMEVIATQGEMENLMRRFAERPYLLFPEDRRFPIRMTDDLPARWMASGPSTEFRGEARPGEFYTFQVGIYASSCPVEDLRVRFSDLTSGQGSVIRASALRCLNLGGTNWLGRQFTNSLSLRQGKVQALWFGVQIPLRASAGDYAGRIVFATHGLPETALDLALAVSGSPMPDAGDGELWRQSRLRWLDSTAGLDNEVAPPYTPIKAKDSGFTVLGREITLARSGLPAKIASAFSSTVDAAAGSSREILARPMRLVVETDTGPVEWQGNGLRTTEQHPGAVSWEAQSAGGGLSLLCRATMDADGYINYALSVKSGVAAELRDVRLEIPLRREVATYMMGLGRKGGLRPSSWKWKWNVSLANHRVWLGDVSAGLHCKLKGAEDTWELYNMQTSGLPDSWHNGGLGGAELTEESPDVVCLRFYSGARRLPPAGEVVFRFGLMATPVKMLDPNHWNWRYWHALSPVEEVARSGANIINIHHGNDLNPFINYPFVAVDKLKPYVEQAHQRGIKVKLYYTIRELSNHAAELWALRSLGDEIYRQGPGFKLADQFVSQSADKGDATTGNAWLCEHLVSGYVPAWHQPFGQGIWDASIATTGLSRWHNYYLEGMAWLIQNIGVDGLYLDGIGYDREIMKRLRKVMERSRPGCLIDFHCGNHYAPEYGLNNIVNQHLEHLPYIDSLWLGEGFDYDETPEYWLVELSGLPFGLYGEMLGVGNPWRGMVYGMSNRLPYAGGDPRELWKLWDSFGIREARMFGYWNSACPVKTSQSNVLATAYVRPGRTLVAVASWAPQRARVTLTLDWKALGLDPAKTTLMAPAIRNYQPGVVFDPRGKIKVEPGRGWLLVADETPRDLSAEPASPDPLRGRRLRAEDAVPFDISIPANTVKTKDMPWAAGATVAAARIDPMRDNGQTWGLGLAVGWPGGKYVQICHRTDGRWGVFRNGTEALLGSHPNGQPATLAVSLTEKTVQILASEDGSSDWDLVAEFPRAEFSGPPTTVRVGKIGPSWTPQNFGVKGPTSPCRIEWIRQYE